jgi:4-alpha-glucanotransferase
VLELETIPERRPPVPKPSAWSLATLNTHDLPTFAAFWRGDDIRERLEDGFLDASLVRTERRRRAAMKADVVRILVGAGLLASTEAEDERRVLSASLAWLGGSDARLVVANLEDLWGERRQQNVPGTVDRPNFCRRAARSLDELRGSPDVLEILRRVDAARRTALMEGDAA